MTAVTQHDLFRRERREPPVQSDVAALIEALVREGITAPADATHAMALLHECSKRYTSPDLRTWLTGADLATLDATRIMTELDSAWVRVSMLRQGSGLVHEVLDVLVARAVEALAADVDRLIGDLRPAWDVAADVVAAAAAIGISSASTAADVIKLGDEAVAQLDHVCRRPWPPSTGCTSCETGCCGSPAVSLARATSASSAGWTGPTPGRRH